MGGLLHPAYTRIGLPNMSFTSTAAQLVNLAEAEGGNHESLNPLVTGGAALAVLLILLLIVTRFNRDR
jgi:hypothetical protein